MFEVQEVTDMDLVLGGKLSELLPPMQSIPNEFGIGKRNKWSKLISDWFFYGIEILRWAPKEGIDPYKALRHIKAIMSSFELGHEYKEAACAYLLSIWFNDIQYEVSAHDHMVIGHTQRR
ncbi:MAG: hypothetical protein HPY74_06095 [Firmicutes bacterium]|nr:hypothetical protein [Bacillota bacterium]